LPSVYGSKLEWWHTCELEFRKYMGVCVIYVYISTVFFISKRSSLKVQGTQLKYTRSIQEKTPSKSRTRKESTKIYKASDIKKGVSGDPLKGDLRKQNCKSARLLAIIEASGVPFSKCTTLKGKGLHSKHY